MPAGADWIGVDFAVRPFGTQAKPIFPSDTCRSAVPVESSEECLVGMPTLRLESARVTTPPFRCCEPEMPVLGEAAAAVTNGRQRDMTVREYFAAFSVIAFFTAVPEKPPQSTSHPPVEARYDRGLRVSTTEGSCRVPLRFLCQARKAAAKKAKEKAEEEAKAAKAQQEVLDPGSWSGEWKESAPMI